jgi:hypothetical protein
MKIFVSTPMNGLDRKQIKANIRKAKKFAEDELGEKLEVIDSLLSPEFCATHSPLECLGGSLKLMAKADVAVFYGDWKKYNGCCIEHEAAMRYGISVLEKIFELP